VIKLKNKYIILAARDYRTLLISIMRAEDTIDTMSRRLMEASEEPTARGSILDRLRSQQP
jgi:hypothetical protein